MSLKAVHIVFISASVLVTLGFGAWSLYQFFAGDRAPLDAVLGGGSLALGVGLIFYGKYFLKKLRNVELL